MLVMVSQWLRRCCCEGIVILGVMGRQAVVWT